MALTPQALWRNRLTYVGAAMAVAALLFMLSFLFFDLVVHHQNPYVGVWTYLVFPVMMVAGIALAIIGLLQARTRFRKEHGSLTTAQMYPQINLNVPTHRRALASVGVAVALTIPVIGLLSYEGYHYTDSNEFCGRVCHEVMEPQFEAYLQSPHARVACAECHIGTGASWYVKSKLSGIRQVFAVAFDSFERPIPPAIQDLRPARETCEQCHWPAKFYGNQLVSIDHFASDEDNTHQRLRMLLKTGGSDPSTGPPSGIHWHMTLGFSIEYVATDERLQEIPWVKMTDHATGAQNVYRSDGLPTDAPPPEGTRRMVDCMDCHNRPTHVFRPPDRAVDTALHVNPTLQSLPYAKRETVKALVQPYLTKAEGMNGVPLALAEFYQEQYPQVWQQRREDVQALMAAAKEIYRANFFPEMNVDWRTYPNNIGHKIVAGCFRCHEGDHVDAAGETISHDCASCHEFLAEANGDDERSLVSIGGFEHPIELEGPHATLRCDRCHTGSIAPAPTCDGCHSEVAAYRRGELPALDRFDIQPDPMVNFVDCEGCHDLSQPTSIEAIDELCMDCHEDEWDKYDGMLASWHAEARGLLKRAADNAQPGQENILRALQGAGPLHNMEATRKILRSLGGEPDPADDATSE